MTENRIAEHCVGENVPDWEHLKFHKIKIDDIGEWTIHTWYRQNQCRREFKCTLSPKRPFAWQEGYDTLFEAVNAWMHVGCEE
jgi:hypothetical protein